MVLEHLHMGIQISPHFLSYILILNNIFVTTTFLTNIFITARYLHLYFQLYSGAEWQLVWIFLFVVLVDPPVLIPSPSRFRKPHQIIF